MNNNAIAALDLGDRYPFDAPDDWWHGEFPYPEPPIASDWAHRAARGVLADLTDRRRIKNGFDDIDQDLRGEIVATLAAIIRAAYDERGDAQS